MGDDEVVAASAAAAKTNGKLPASRAGAIRVLNRQIAALKKQRNGQNDEIAKYKTALAASNYTLRQNHLEVPAAAQVVAGTIDSSEAPSVRRSAILHVSVGNEVVDQRKEIPYRMDMCNLPDTTSITSDIRFPASVSSFPHAVCKYKRTNELLAPHVDQRRPIVLTWKLVDRRDITKQANERHLIPNVLKPVVKFRCDLVYDDDGSRVTLESLGDSSSHLKAISEPNVLNGAEEKMVNGSVTFRIKRIEALSGSTKPQHRKFRFELVCLNSDLAKHTHCHGSSCGFYNLARLRIEGETTTT